MPSARPICLLVGPWGCCYPMRGRRLPGAMGYLTQLHAALYPSLLLSTAARWVAAAHLRHNRHVCGCLSRDAKAV